MHDGRYLFVTGIARGGTSLIGRMIDAHGAMRCAIDAFLPLFRSVRDHVASAADSGRFAALAKGPMTDGHFVPLHRDFLDAMAAAALSEPLAAPMTDGLLDAIARRSSDESPDLLPHLDLVRGATCRELVESVFACVGRARPRNDAAWTAIKDLWIVDQFRPLSRAFPEARFVIVVRDPRAIVHSVIGFLAVDPSQVANLISIARQWRKLAAYATHLVADPALRDRLLILGYEEVVAAPRRQAERLCRFLGVPFEAGMVDLDAFKDHVTGGAWAGNSTFERMSRISTASVERWRKGLDPALVALVEFACEADMRVVGYQPINTSTSLDSDPRVLAALIADSRREPSWRCDFQDPMRDYGCEAFRRSLLRGGLSRVEPQWERLCFLFPEHAKALAAKVEHGS